MGTDEVTRQDEISVRDDRRARGNATIRRPCAQGPICTARGNHEAGSRVQAPVRNESEQARTEAEDQACRFGPRGSRALEGFRPFSNLAGQFGVREAPANDLANQKTEAVGITQWQSVVEAERLF